MRIRNQDKDPSHRIMGQIDLTQVCLTISILHVTLQAFPCHVLTWFSSTYRKCWRTCGPSFASSRNQPTLILAWPSARPFWLGSKVRWGCWTSGAWSRMWCSPSWTSAWWVSHLTGQLKEKWDSWVFCNRNVLDINQCWKRCIWPRRSGNKTSQLIVKEWSGSTKKSHWSGAGVNPRRHQQGFVCWFTLTFIPVNGEQLTPSCIFVDYRR